MPSAGFAQMPLRGFVPYAELDTFYDLLRASMCLEVGMWEGCDRPFCRSINFLGPGGHWVRPEPVLPPNEPQWNTDAIAYSRGVNHSGHVGQAVYATNENTLTGKGWRYDDVLDPVLSRFVIGRNFSVLMVGTPLTFMNPGTANPGDSQRVLWGFWAEGYGFIQKLNLNYALNQMVWYEGAAFSLASPIIPFYGKRVAMLFVHGDEGGVTLPPRVYVATEGGEFARANFATSGGTTMFTARRLELFTQTGFAKQMYTAGGVWEYFAYFLRGFEAAEACAICRDALGVVKMDPHALRRNLWRARAQIIATPSVYGRVSARPSARGIVAAAPAAYQRVSATGRSTGPRVSSTPITYQRISARIRIADKEADVQATPLCPSELNFDADNVLALTEVMDDLQDPPAPITTADSVSCEIFDRDTGTELTAVSPVTLTQVGSTNEWRSSVLVNASNGFSLNQRIQLIFIFDGGTGLHGRFEALAVVVSATS